MSENDAVIADLQTSLMRMTEERDHWRKVAMGIATEAISRPHAYYGRTVEYAIADAQSAIEKRA